MHNTQRGTEYHGVKIYRDSSGRRNIEFYAFVDRRSEDYLFIFHTHFTAVDTFYPSYQNILYSFLNNTTIHKDISLYNDTRREIRIQYPDSWKLMITKNPLNVVTFSPPSWISISFKNTINVFSFYESEPDFVNSFNWDQPDNWTTKLEVVSPHEMIQMPNSTILLNHSVPLNVENQGNNTIDLSLDLSLIGYPNPFTVLSTFTGIFETAYRGMKVECTLRDLTNWVQLPPPKITLSLTPNSIRLSPGEEKSIELQVNSSTSLSTNVTLRSNTIQDLQTVISPIHLYLTPHEISSATIHVRASDYYITNSKGSMDNTLEIIGSASLPGNVTEITPGGSTFPENKANASIPLLPAFVAVTVENPKPALDQIRDVFHSSVVTASEMAGLLTTIISIVTSVGLVGGWLFTRRQEKRGSPKNRDSEFKSGSPL
jgi:hypothetical protein